MWHICAALLTGRRLKEMSVACGLQVRCGMIAMHVWAHAAVEGLVTAKAGNSAQDR